MACGEFDLNLRQIPPGELVKLLDERIEPHVVELPVDAPQYTPEATGVHDSASGLLKIVPPAPTVVYTPGSVRPRKATPLRPIYNGLRPRKRPK